MFTVRIKNTSLQFTASAEETVLQAALRQDVYLPWGCGGGICGMCMGQVLEGRMVYPDGPPLALFEEDEEQGKGLVCTGYARSDLLLELPELEGQY